MVTTAIKERDLPTSLDMISHEKPGQGMPKKALGLVGQFFGRPGIELFRQARDLGRNNGVDQSLRQVAEEEFARRAKSRFSLPEGTNPLSFYQLCEADATDTITELVRRFPGKEQALELSEEARTWTEHPTDALKLLALKDKQQNGQDDGIDARLRFEILRREILADGSGKLKARVAGDEPRDALLSTLLVLGNKVYEGPLGDGNSHTTHSYHDPYTNAFKGLVTNGSFPPNAIERKHPFTVRLTQDGFGPVYMRSRIKGAESSLLKALSKAGNRKKDTGIVKPDDVTDNSGVLFVVMNEKKLNPFIMRVIDAVEHHHPRRVVDIKYDPQPGNDRGQARVKFERWQVLFAETANPLELQFFKVGDYLDSLYEVGKKDKQSGDYSGRAHELYELRRMADLLRRLFPECFYGETPNEAIRDAMDKKAQELLVRNRAN